MSSATEEAAGIAIIGIGCRFPGNADSPAAFWEMLRNGVDAITDIPADRPQLTQVYDPDPSKPGKSYLRRGGFVERVDEWDAAFFGISPREAAHMDPQHRLLIEVAWEALEDAGQNVDALAGSRTGVFVGISTHEYGDILSGPANRHRIDGHSNSGSAACIAANRISYLLDFRGPSFTVDTACSSSLTAAHLACRSLSAGDCDLAVVGGVQIQLSPDLTIGFCKAMMISPTGECRAFDASANGYVRGEGAGVVVLKPLAKALADGDPVYAVIVGSAINEDGRTVGLTVPSANAQEAMVREALLSAGLVPADVNYVEAHGTGTAVGDPIEAEALGAVLREGRAPGDYCAMGSVKSNIGHLEAAAGVAGLIKAALCVSHREIPASLHYHTPNPNIDFEAGRLRVVTAQEPWVTGPAPAIAGVNSFGFGGANAHVLVREAPPGANRPTDREHTPSVLPLSARSPEALAELARRYIQLLGESDAPSLADIASTAAQRRAHHAHRIAVVADTHADAIEALDAALAARAQTNDGGKLAFAFGGMGPQWWGMGQQLRRDNPVFRATLERCHEALRPHARWSLLDEMARDEKTSRLSEPDIAQVTNFALQAALVAVWGSWGIVPDAVVGHSAGEIAAAHVSGALTLEQAIEAIYHRSRVQSKAPPGRILAVGMAAADLEPLLREYGGDAEIAAVNSPVSCAVAGSTAAVESLLARLERDQVFARMLTFAVPYHSARMDPIRDELIGVLSSLRPRANTIPIVSTVSGTWVDGTTLDAKHWWLNTRRMVRFADAMTTLLDSGHTTVLEVSPHPVLAGSITECLAARQQTATILGSLRRKEDERTAMLRSLARLYTQGRPVEWDGVFVGPRSNVRLPAYPWQRERHWFASAPVDDNGAHAPLDNGVAEHPLLGRRIRAARPLWESSLGDERLAFLDEHVVQGTVLFPAAAYVEMALGAAHALRATGADASLALQSISFKRALAIESRAGTLVQIDVDADSRRFEIHALCPNGAWTLHADGTLGDAASHTPGAVDMAGIRARCTNEVSSEHCYAALASGGLEYGPAFRGIARLWTGSGEALGQLRLSADAGAASYQMHPALLDAVFQLLVGASGGTPGNSVIDDASDGSVLLPTTLRELTLGAPIGDACWAHARLVTRDDTGVEGNIDILDDHGSVLASISGFRCKRIAGARPRESLDQWLYEYRWERRLLGGSGARSRVDAAPSEVASRVQPEADALSAEWHWDEYYTRLLPRLPAVTVAYMLRALEQLAGPLAAGMSFTLETLGVAAARRPLAEHVMKVLADAGVLQREGAGWEIVELSANGELPETLSRTIATDFPAYSTDLALFVRCATHLADVLTGNVDPETALFAGEGADLVARFYRETPGARYYNTVAAAALGAAATRSTTDADARPLRVLEIGGGMGGTTAYALPKLDAARVEYVFTDITPLFTEQAKLTFGDRAYFSARPLDIERDPIAQGFAPHSFDIVLAANVFHATPSLTATLAHVKRLLAPGGTLVLLELTRPAPWLDLIFGLTPGWWRFADHDLRPSHPLLGGAAWRALLERSGFEDVAAVADTARDGEAAQTVFLARASTSTSPEQIPAVDGQWLIFADRRGVGAALAERVAALGVRAALVEQGRELRQRDDGIFELPIDDAVAAAGLIGMFEVNRQRPRGIVFLWTLDADAADAVVPDELLETQRVGLGSALALVQALAALPGDLPELWFVTSSAQPTGRAPEVLATTQAPVWGFARVITKEQRGLRTRLVDLSAECSASEIDALAREIATPEWEDELALRGEHRYVRRLHRVSIGDLALSSPSDSPVPDGGQNFRAEIATPGSLESLTLRRVERTAPGRGEVEIAVAATGLNFRDVMIAMGVYPALANEASFSRGLLGIDCAGTITRCGDDVTEFAVGDDVVGIAAGAFGAYVITPAALVARRPRMLSHAQAAAIPAAFVTALYSLRDLARLERGERVLIHAATGGVGLAAIQVAREVGAEIFATAGSVEKREFLTSLGIAHVMDSRSLRFADEVMEYTGGEGVDVVLNSLPGEAIARGIDTLREGGRFVEIGKRDIYQDSRIGLLAFRRNLSLFAVDIDRLGLTRPDRLRSVLRDVIERFDSTAFEALPLHEFPISRVEDAMRLMAQAKHIGKVVVSMDDPAVVLAPAIGERVVVRGNATYLITGGLGGFGLLVAEWLAREGAGCIVLVGRSGAVGDAGEQVRRLRERRPGVRVEVMRADVSRAADVRRVFADVRATMPPLRGVIHAGMVLDDVPLTEMDRERLDRVLAPKMAGAWHLHQETLNEALDWFVMFSSLAAIIGNPYQANYCAANAFLDALAHQRRAVGLPGLSISWGMLSKAGYLSRHVDVAQYLERQGYLPFTPAQAFEVLSALLRHDVSHVMAARVEWPRWLESSPAAGVSGILRQFAESPAERGARGTTLRGEAGSLRAELIAASAEIRRERVTAFLRETVCKVLGLSSSKLQNDRPLTDLGFDSLMAVELITALSVRIGVEVAAVKLLQGMSVSALAELVLERLAAEGGASSAASVIVPAANAPAVQETASAEAGLNNGGSAHNGGAIHPSPAPTNGSGLEIPSLTLSPYSALDYSRPTNGLRALRGAVRLALHTVAKVRIEGLEHLPPTGGCLLATNHLSAADLPVLFSVVQRRTVMYAAERLRSSRVLNWLFADVGDTIYVRRGERDTEALESGLAVLRAGGLLALSPEGTRSQTGALARGRTGVAYLAMQAGVPVVPIALWGQERMPARWRSMRRAPVMVRIGPPLWFPHREPDAAELRSCADQVMRSIAELLPEEYRGVYGERALLR